MDPDFFNDSLGFPLAVIPNDFFDSEESSLLSGMLKTAISSILSVRKFTDIFKQIKKDRYISRFKRNSKAKYRVRKRIVPYKRKLRNHITST